MSTRVKRAVDRAVDTVPNPVLAVVAVALFLFAVQLLGTATQTAAPILRQVFHRFVGGDASALGLGWLSAYLVGNGSVVAALAVSLFAAEIISPAQLFLLVAGSRLGAVAIVVFIGALDWVQKERYTLRKSIQMGLLTFTLTHSIYLPVTVIGYLSVPSVDGVFRRISHGWSIGIDSLAIFGPVTGAITGALGPVIAFLVAVALLLASLKLFDRVLARIDIGFLRSKVFNRFDNPALAFAIGLVVTGLTTSVAFSLGVIVPLYNRGYIERDELVPYVLGANLGTLVDTLLVAIVLGSPGGIAIVLELLAIAALVTAVALVALPVYTRAIVALDQRLVDDRRAFIGFVASLIIVPLILLVGPMVLR